MRLQLAVQLIVAGAAKGVRKVVEVVQKVHIEVPQDRRRDPLDDHGPLPPLARHSAVRIGWHGGPALHEVGQAVPGPPEGGTGHAAA